MSARPQRIEVITRGQRRRRWSLEEKQAIVAESLAPNASPTAVARRHEIGTRLLYAWRHQLLGRRPDEAARFARVDVLSDPHRLSGPVIAEPAQRSGLIEIILPPRRSKHQAPPSNTKARADPLSRIMPIQDHNSRDRRHVGGPQRLRRRRSPRVITSIRCGRALLRPLV